MRYYWICPMCRKYPSWFMGNESSKEATYCKYVWRGLARSKYLTFKRRFKNIKIKILKKNDLKKLGVL